MEQARRHATIASLLGVPNLVVCVNKMDLADYDRAPFDRIRGEFDAFAANLRETALTHVPISALHGDNVVTRSARMPWYTGPALLEYLERVPTRSSVSSDALRLPVQLVLDAPRAADGPPARLLAGRIEAGSIGVGDRVRSLATGELVEVSRVLASGVDVERAETGLSVAVGLAPDPMSGRGDLLASEPLPALARTLSAWLCWLVPQPLTTGSSWSIKHLTRTTRARCTAVNRVLDINTHTGVEGRQSVGLNEIALVEFQLDEPLFVDRYQANRATGSFIVLDDVTNDTAGAGMIEAWP